MVILNDREYNDLVMRISNLELLVIQLQNAARNIPITIDTYGNPAGWYRYCHTCGQNIYGGYVCGNTACPNGTRITY